MKSRDEMEEMLDMEESPEMEDESSGDSLIEPMSDDDIISFVSWQLQNNTLGAWTAQREEEIAEAMKYFFLELRGDEVEGRSQVISPDLPDSVEAMLADMLPAFAGDIGVFPPQNPEDEHPAAQESKLVNHILMEENCGFIHLLSAIKDAMLQRNGYIKAFWDTRMDVRYETLNNVPQILLPRVVAPKQPGEEVSITRQEMTGPGVFNIELRRKTPFNKIRIEGVPPEEIRVQSNWKQVSLRDCPVVAHVRSLSKSDLIASGYDPAIVKSLSKITQKVSTADQARNRDSQEGESYPAAWQNEEVMVVDAYLLIDVDGDGIAERRRVVLAGGSEEDPGKVLLEKDPFWGVPIASMTCFVVPHRHQGMSLHEKLKQIVDSKTAFLRQTLDNGYIVNNSRMLAQTGMVNMDDLLTSRAGGVIRCRDINSVKPLPVERLGDVGFSMLSYLDKIRKETAGSSLDATANGIQVPRDSSHAAERLFSSLERLAAMVARTVAETGLSEIYVIVHRMLMEYSEGDIARKVGREWIQSRPEKWRPRDRVAVTIGLSEGERYKQFQTLGALIERAMVLLSKPETATLTNRRRLYNLLVDLGRAGGMDEPEQYWVDPASQEGQQAAQNAQKAAQAAQQGQMEQQQQQNQLLLRLQAMQEETSRLKAQMEQQTKMMDRQFNYDKLFEDMRAKLLDLELKYQENVSPEKTSVG